MDNASRRGKQRHVMGRFRDDAPPPVERGAPNRWIRRPGCLLLLGLLLAVLSAAVTAVVLLLIFLKPGAPQGQNAIWMGIDWGQGIHEDEEVKTLADSLRREGIDTLYVWMSWLQEDGTWSETTFANMGVFLEQFRHYYPDARLDAWIGIPTNVPQYRLDDEAIREEIAAFSKQVLAEYDFDGIHLNAEPVWDGDEHYLALLREVRQEIGSEVTFSVAVPPDWNAGRPNIPSGPFTTEEAHWSQEYKRRVAFLVDEIAVMAYNSGLSTPEDYKTWMAFQVAQYLTALSSLDVETRLIVGIPTYDAEPPGHDPAVESVQAAIEGILLGEEQAGGMASLLRGVGIYAYWSTDPLEWAAYRQYWLNRKEQ